jgi:hypothetical protein
MDWWWWIPACLHSLSVFVQLFFPTRALLTSWPQDMTRESSALLEHLQQLSSFFLHGSGILTQGYGLLRQALYHLRHTLSLFLFRDFSGRVWYFCPGWISNGHPPTFTSHVAGDAGMHHHTLLVFWGQGLSSFCLLMLASKLNPPISTSHVARITDALHQIHHTHHTQHIPHFSLIL